MTIAHEVKTRGERIGDEEQERGWTLESNTAVKAMINAMGCTSYETYRLFENPLAQPVLNLLERPVRDARRRALRLADAAAVSPGGRRPHP